MTSGGNRNPAKPDLGADSRAERRCINSAWPLAMMADATDQTKACQGQGKNDTTLFESLGYGEFLPDHYEIRVGDAVGGGDLGIFATVTVEPLGDRPEGVPAHDRIDPLCRGLSRYSRGLSRCRRGRRGCSRGLSRRGLGFSIQGRARRPQLTTVRGVNDQVTVVLQYE